MCMHSSMSVSTCRPLPTGMCVHMHAGGAAHLPGMTASMTPLPVIGVPVKPAGCSLDGMDALLSICQMPKGVPVSDGTNEATAKAP